MNNDIKILCGMIHEFMCKYDGNDVRNRHAKLPTYRELEKEYVTTFRDLCKRNGGYRKIKNNLEIIYK